MSMSAKVIYRGQFGDCSASFPLLLIWFLDPGRTFYATPSPSDWKACVTSIVGSSARTRQSWKPQSLAVNERGLAETTRLLHLKKRPLPGNCRPDQQVIEETT